MTAYPIDSVVTASQGTTPWVVTGSVTAAQGQAGPYSNAWPVRLVTPDNDLADYGSDGRLRVGVETIELFDHFDGLTLNTNIWFQSNSGMTLSQSGSALTFNTTNATTSGSFASIVSIKKFNDLVEFPHYCQFRAATNSITNSVIEFGFGGPVSASLVTDGVYFRCTGSSVLGVMSFSGSEVTTFIAPVTSLSASQFYNFEVFIYEDKVKFEIDDPTGSLDVTSEISIPGRLASANSQSHLATFARIFNAGVTATPAQLAVGSVNVQQMDAFISKPWSHQLAASGRAAYVNPSTYVQTANYNNNAAPGIASLSNTSASYASLGGLFQVTAPAGSETDYALFAFQVPSGFQLYVTNVSICSFIVGAQSSTAPTLLQWGVGLNSSGVSLATGAPYPPLKVAIGLQQAPKTAAVGDTFNPSNITYTPATPLIIDSGRYFHVILRVPIGNATSGQSIRGSVTIEGYFE